MFTAIGGTNVLSYRKFHVVLPTRGLVNIHGVVTDRPWTQSNGAGKSAIITIICWVLFGKHDRGNADAIVNNTAKRGCMAWVEFHTSSGQHLVRITRYRKHPTHKNQVIIVVDDVEQATDDSQTLICQLLGYDEEVFRRGSIFDSKSSFSQLKDAEAKDFLDRVLATNYDYYLVKAKVAVTHLESDIFTLQHVVLSHGPMVAQLQASLVPLQTASQQWETAAEAKFNAARLQEEQLRVELHPYLPYLAVAGNQAEMRAWQQATTSVAQIRATLTHSQNTVARLQSAISPGSSVCPTCGQAVAPKDMSPLVAQIQAEQQHYASAQQQLHSAEVAVEQAKMALTAKQQEEDWRQHGLALQARLLAAERAKHEVQNPVNPYTAQIQRTTADAETAQSAINHAEEQARLLKGKLPWYKVVADMFDKRGLKAFLVDLVVPFINRQLATYLSYLSDREIEAKLELKNDKVNVAVTKLDGGEGYASLSQGQKARLDTAFILALHDFLEQIKPTRLLILDEVFDQLDTAGIERVATILQKKAADNLILVISHNPHLTNYAETNIRVVMRNNTSTIDDDIPANGEAQE